MRQILFLWLVLAGVGCEALHKHCRPECPVEEKKPVGAPKEKVAGPAPEAPAPMRVAAAQEVLLVPTVVYRPFVAQSPTAPVKLGANMTVLPQQPEKVGAPNPPPDQPEKVGAPKTDDNLRKALDHCEKLEARCADLERRLRDRVPAAAPPCPPPLFRRPLFPIFDPRCEPAPACDPAPALPMPAPTSPMPTSSDAPVYNID